MEKIYRKLKRQNGEKFAQVIRNHHNGILEIPNILTVLRHAGHAEEHARACLPYLTNLLLAQQGADKKKRAKPADPFELLEKAGYRAFWADTLKKQNSIKKFFAPGEELCTFNDRERYKPVSYTHLTLPTTPYV